MKPNNRIDYRALTGAHYTTFAQTQQSEQILARNRGLLKRISDTAHQNMNQKSRAKQESILIGGKVDSYV